MEKVDVDQIKGTDGERSHCERSLMFLAHICIRIQPQTLICHLSFCSLREKQDSDEHLPADPIWVVFFVSMGLGRATQRN